MAVAKPIEVTAHRLVGVVENATRVLVNEVDIDNLMSSDEAARTVALAGAQPVTGWQDLLSGERQAAGELTLAPNEVLFLRLDP